MKHFTVFGNPIAHSQSPQIHAQFAQQLGHRIYYSRSLTSNGQFHHAVSKFFRNGGAGANVTVPFKGLACDLVTHLTKRAWRAGSVNTLIPLGDGQLLGDSTDGEGLVRDLTRFISLSKTNVLMLGAGGAARSALDALLQAGASVTLSNRSRAKCDALQQLYPELQIVDFEKLTQTKPAQLQFDLVINATSAGHTKQSLQLHPSWWRNVQCAYDLSYGKAAEWFLAQAQQQQVATVSDGYGMLVEQAALSYALWQGVEVPDTQRISREG